MATLEKPEVSVSGRITPFKALDNVRKAVCLLKSSSQDPRKSWSGTGFYVNVKLKKKGKVNDVHCIMTNHHVFLEMKQRRDNMVAVFHYEDTEMKHFELHLVPFKLFAQSTGDFEKLDYVLIRVDESQMRDMGVKPILVDHEKIPEIYDGDTVYIIQHPEGGIKQFSQDTVKRVNKPFIEYYADTLKGSSGSPVFLLHGSECSLVALHSKGVAADFNSYWNKGVLISDILEHLHTGKVTMPKLPLPGVPGEIESGVVLGKKDPHKPVLRKDIINIAQDITKEWFQLGRVLGHEDNTLEIIDADYTKVYEKSYQMLIRWTQAMVSKATYGALAAGFANPTVNRHDLIDKHC